MSSFSSIRAVALLALWSSLAAATPLKPRNLANQGWSLQTSSCPADSTSCGGGACCPSSSFCQAGGNTEVAVCCPSSTNCIGDVEGAPSCADSAWSLWKGTQGNGFCCEVGLQGAYYNGDSTAGICASTVPSGYIAAQLMSQGTGSTATGAPTLTAAATTVTTTQTLACSTTTSTPSAPTGSSSKLVFAHYMIGTTNASTNHAALDVQQAMAMGLDAFAMNVGAPTASWAQSTVQQLFAAADQTNGQFKLFFNFDLSADSTFSDHVSLWTQFNTESSYLLGGPNNYPVVSSFSGYNQYSDWQNFKQSYDVSLLPNLDGNFGGAGDTSEYYTDPSSYLSEFTSIVDGFFSWESAWPPTSNSPVSIDSTGDQTVLNWAHSVGKTYMMGLSTLQYKDCCGGEYYRTGESNMPDRITEILDLQPDYTEIITWNDGGESHYIGNLWLEAYNSAPQILVYANTETFPHYAWQPIMTSFIEAYKAGNSASEMAPPSDTPIGAMWYHPTLTSCSAFGDIQGAGAAQDAVNYAIVLPQGSSGMSVVINSGGAQIGQANLQPGLNYGTITIMNAGAQQIQLLSNGQVTMIANSQEDVPESSSTCNFNYYVVGLEST